MPGDGERPSSHRGLSGTGDTRTSTLSSQKSSPGSKPIKAVALGPNPGLDSPTPNIALHRESEFSQSCEERGVEDLFNSTFRLTPERVWKPKKKDKEVGQHPEVRVRLASAGRGGKRRPLSLEQEPRQSERRMPIIQSRRIIRTARNLPKGAPPSLLPGGEKYDLLLPPRFKK